MIKAIPKHDGSAKLKNVLIIGLYDRDNIGVDIYKDAFSFILRKEEVHHITFKNIDDLQSIPPHTDTILCGGGEVINSIFMPKVLLLTESFPGQIYAVSVNLASEDDVKYLDLFDHVFLRSMKDYNLAVKHIGEQNCTYVPDVSFILHKMEKGTSFRRSKTAGCWGSGEGVFNIGVCLEHDPVSSNLDNISTLVKVLGKLIQSDDRVCLNLFSFNTHLVTKSECDVYLNERISFGLPPYYIKRRCFTHYNSTPRDMYRKIGTMDFNICMRYHAIVFSLMNRIPFLALYKSRRIDMLLEDLDMIKSNYKFEDEIEFTRLFNLIKIQIETRKNLIADDKQYSSHKFDIIRKYVISQKQKVIPVPRRNVGFGSHIWGNNDTLEDVYTRIESEYYNAIASRKLDFNTRCQIICHLMTGDTYHQCLDGLHNVMKHEDVQGLHDMGIKSIISYIYENVNKEHDKSKGTTHVYFPTSKTLRRFILNIDPHFGKLYDGTGDIWSGWKYVVGGLMNLDANFLMRGNLDDKVILDTYIDRTFGWGALPTELLGLIPYTTPWIGVIHHTFNETFNEYNCVNLFKNNAFLRSLSHCEGIMVLSNYLQQNIKVALKEAGHEAIPVGVFQQPAEFDVEEFTMSKFLQNSHKKVVQIGTWLRNQYAIYQLPLEKSFNNDMHIRKAILKGKENNAFFRPIGLLQRITIVLDESSEEFSDKLLKLKCENEEKYLSRMNTGGSSVNNKYCEGLLNAIVSNDESVEVLDYKDAEEYNKLLSRNIVFLNLIDCSSINTVIECIVRNTPLLVNKHPALEEILGEKYPGFYGTFLEACHILSSEKKIRRIFEYLVDLDKSSFHLEAFMKKFVKWYISDVAS